MLLVILDGSLNTNYRNDYHGSTIKDRVWQWKLNTTKLGLIFNLNMLSAILDGIQYQKS